MLKQRHTLVHFEPAVFDRLKPAILDGFILQEVSRELRQEAEAILDQCAMPGIVCRPPEPLANELVRVGFSFPLKAGHERLRAAITITADQVASCSTPWGVAKRAAQSDLFAQRPVLKSVISLRIYDRETRLLHLVLHLLQQLPTRYLSGRKLCLRTLIQKR